MLKHLFALQLVAALICVQTARANSDYAPIDINSVVTLRGKSAVNTALSARLCVLQKARMLSIKTKQHDLDSPETYDKLIKQTNLAIRDIGTKPMNCRLDIIKRSQACLASIIGEIHIPLSCTREPTLSILMADQAIPLEYKPIDPSPLSAKIQRLLTVKFGRCTVTTKSIYPSKNGIIENVLFVSFDGEVDQLKVADFIKETFQADALIHNFSQIEIQTGENNFVYSF